MNNLHGILLTYHSSPYMQDLTEHRTTSSLPYGGQYRVVDFMLSSFVSAGITDVGVIMQENYQSLLDHLGSGKDWDLSRKWGGLKLLPPFAYSKKRASGFQGEMEALGGVYTYLQQIRQDYVILSTGDLVASLPLRPFLEAHIKSGADITPICTKNTLAQPEFATYFRLGEDGSVEDVCCGGENTLDCESLDVYILSKALLLRLTDHCAAHNLYSFSKDVLQGMCRSLSIIPCFFSGYAARIQSSDAYFSRSMELFSPSVRASLFHPDRPIRTKDRWDPSTYYGPDASVQGALVADGCIIEGTVENSILFRGVRVEKGAHVKDCILMQDTKVEKDSILRCVIADKGVSIHEGRTLMSHKSYPLILAKGKSV